MSDDPWDAIRLASSRECPDCGGEVASSDSACPTCGAPMGEEAEASFSFMAAEERAGEGAHPKISLENSRNLHKLREARDGLLSGALDADGYRVMVQEVLNVAHLGVEIFKTPAVRQKLAAMPPEEVDLVRQTEEQMRALHAAVSRMAEGEAEAGCREAEAAYVRLDAIQDQALERSAHYGS